MMTYEEFREVLLNGLSFMLEGPGELMINSVTLNNGRITEYLCLNMKDRAVAPAVYIEQAYGLYRRGKSVGNVLKIVINELTNNRECIESNLIIDWNKARNKVYPQLINTKLNEDMLKDTPHKNLFDLSVVYYIQVSEIEDNQKLCCFVNNFILDKWGISLEELHEVSKRNLEKNKPAIFGKLSTFGPSEARELPDVTEEFIGEADMYVLTDRDNYMGAAYLMFPDVFERIARVVGDNLIILPSSVHELIIVKKEIGMSADFMALIVKEVNSQNVNPDEVLSESVYGYSEGELKIIV